MRVLAYEFVTGGGLLGEAVPSSLAREADLMLRRLVEDLLELPGITVVAPRDPRFGPLPGVESPSPAPSADWRASFRAALGGVDAAWPTAPETGGVLEDLARMTLAAGVPLLGSAPDAVRLAASKLRSSELLRARGCAAAPLFAAADRLPPLPGRWIVKPDDGAGATDTEVTRTWREAATRLRIRKDGPVAGPWVEGDPRSLSVLCADGQARLLAVNRQSVRERAGRLTVAGLAVNATADHAGTLAVLAALVASAMPGLWGYVGIDYIETRRGPVVLDINPRLTTSYCGLRPALGVNLPALVLGLRRSGALPAAHTIPRALEPIELGLEMIGG